MRTGLLWLLGDLLGTATIDTWNWLWQVPADPTPPGETANASEIVLARTTQILLLMAERVAAIQCDVTSVRNRMYELQRHYDSQFQAYIQLKKVSASHEILGNEIESEVAKTKALAISQILPELKSRLTHCQEILLEITEYQAQEQAKLDLKQSELILMKVRLAVIDRQDSTTFQDLNQLLIEFENCRDELEDLYQQVQAMIQLANQSNCILFQPINPDDPVN
jgi:hypothetical protein